jgi:AI-2 transport protein TqsA
MKTELRSEQIWLAVGSLMILATVALAASLSYTRPVMIPFVLAIFIMTVVSPVVDYQVVRWGLPRSVAISVALLLVLAILVVLGLLLIAAIQMMVATAGEYSESFGHLTENVLSRLKDWKIAVDPTMITEGLTAKLPGIVTQTMGTATGLLSSGFLILIFVVFLLAGRTSHPVRSGIYFEIELTIRRYLATKLALSMTTGFLVWLILAIFGLRMAPVFGMLAFLLNFIPSIGSVIATLLPIPVAVAQFDSVGMIVAVIVVPGAVQMIIGNVIEPKLMGQGLELHPVTVLLALAFWGLLWGPVGMLLAVPITASIRTVLVRFIPTKPIGDLLAGQLPGST